MTNFVTLISVLRHAKAPIQPRFFTAERVVRQYFSGDAPSRVNASFTKADRLRGEGLSGHRGPAWGHGGSTASRAASGRGRDASGRVAASVLGAGEQGDLHGLVDSLTTGSGRNTI